MVEKKLKNLTLSEYNLLEGKDPQGIYDRETREKLYWIIAKLERDDRRKTSIEKKLLKKFKKTNLGFLMPKGSQSNGILNFDSVLQIEGKFQGEIRGPRVLIIGVEAIIEAKITAENIICHGSINGDIIGLEKVEILKTGRLIGDVKSPSLHIEQGALFKGKCHMPINIEKLNNRSQKRKRLFFLAG